MLKQFFINVQVSVWDVEAVMITKKQVKNQMHCCCLFRWVKQRLMGNLNRCVNQCLVKLKLRQWMPLTSLDVSEQEATVTCVPFRQAIPKMMNVYLRWHLPTSPQLSGQPQVSKLHWPFQCSACKYMSSCFIKGCLTLETISLCSDNFDTSILTFVICCCGYSLE